MDLADLCAPIARQEEGAWTTIFDIEGAPMDIEIRIAGPDSERQRKGRYATIERFKNKVDRRGSMSAEDSDNMAVDLLARSVIEWKNIESEGQPLECSHANVVRVLTAVPWIRTQVDVFASSRAPYRNSPQVPAEREDHLALYDQADGEGVS